MNKKQYRVKRCIGKFKKGDIVVLFEDDGSDCPFFVKASLDNPTWGRDAWAIAYSDLEEVQETPHVDDVYESLTDGQRYHMLCKLGKHGYDARTEETIARHKKAFKERTAPTKTYCLGDRLEVDGVLHILAQVGPYVCCLISLRDGNRHNEPIEVKNLQQITQAELERMQ